MGLWGRTQNRPEDAVSSAWGDAGSLPITRSVLSGWKDGTRAGREYVRLARAHDSIVRGVRQVPVWDPSMASPSVLGTPIKLPDISEKQR